MPQRARWPLYLIPIAMLGAALLPMPYGYYQFLRLIVCGAAILGAIDANQRGDQPSLIVLAMLAVLYNPVFRIHLDRETWGMINVATAAAFAAVGFRHFRSISSR